MTIALWCLFFAALMHIITKMPLASAQAKASGGYDNDNPREQQSQLQGMGQRALAAHQNQIESFPLFAAGVVVATLFSPASAVVGYLAIAHVVSRLAYMYLYLANQGSLRSFIWLVSFFTSLALICSPAWLR